MKKLFKIFAIIVFTTAMPLIVIEMIIKRQGNYASRIQSSFHVMLFVVELGGQEL